MELLFDTLRSKQNGRYFPDDIFKCISLMKMYEFWSRFHWILFLRVQLTIFQHGFRQWLGTKYVRSLYMKQWCPCLLTHICITLPQWVKSRMCCHSPKQISTHLPILQPGIWFIPKPICDHDFHLEKLECAASNGNRYPPYPQVMATAISQ